VDRRIKFRHLEAFIAIARAKRLKRAAEQLNLTQPAISKTLKDLETILGVALMVRDRAGVRLTAEGQIFLQYAEQSAASLRQGLSSLATLGAAGGASLRVGALPSAAGGALALAVERFRAQAPGTVLWVEEGTHEHLTSELRAGGLDIVVGRVGDAGTMSGLSFTALHSETVVAVVAPDHPRRGATRLDQIAGDLVLYPPRDAAIRPLVARLMLSRGMALFENRIETVSSTFGRSMTLGPLRPVWFISQGVVAEDLARGHLVALDIDMGPTVGAVGIMVRAEEAPGPLVQLLRQSLVEAVAQGR
jgi:LysR family pca operon transcriptional activator